MSDDPNALARAATRAELRSPGSMERAFAGAGSGGRGGRVARPSASMVGRSLLGTVAGVVVGSAIAQAFLPDPASFESGGDGGGTDGSGADASADGGGYDGGGYDGAGTAVTSAVVAATSAVAATSGSDAGVAAAR